MNKNLLTGIGVCGVLLMGSIYTASASTSGYDVLKESFKKTRQAESLTAQVKLTIEDNGKTVYQVDAECKNNQADQLQNKKATITKGDVKTIVHAYQQNEKMYVTREGTDKIIQLNGPHKGPGRHHGEPSEEMKQEMENIFDALTSDLHDQVIVQEGANGTKEVTMELTETEIPAAVSAIGTFIVKHANEGHKKHNDSFHQEWFTDVKPELPALTDSIHLNRITLSAEIGANGFVEEKAVQISFTGKDQQGAQHNLEVSVEADLTDFNQTSVVPFDLTGKQVEEINMKHKE